MRRLVGASLLTLAFLAACAVEAHAQKDKKKDDKKDQPAVDSAKLSGEFAGTLKTTPGTDRTFLVSVEVKKLVPTGKTTTPYRGNNTNVSRILTLQNKIASDQVHMKRARTPQQMRQYYQHLLRDQQQLQAALIQLVASAARSGGLPAGYRIDTTKQDVEFQASETVKVRTLMLPDAFDDKGSPKKYTKEEKDELKGKDKNAVGYESSLEKLEPGMKIRLVLGAAPKKKEDKKEDADKDKDDLKDKDADKKMQVKLLVILEEASSPAPNPKGKKNK